MVINVTRWYPDTCSCVIEYEWDSEQNEDERVHKFKSIVGVCPDHTSLSGDGLFQSVLKENRMKNMLLPEIQNIVPDFDNDKHYKWSFDKTRTLKVNLAHPYFTSNPNQKKTVQDICDTKYGKGKVVIQ